MCGGSKTRGELSKQALYKDGEMDTKHMFVTHALCAIFAHSPVITYATQYNIQYNTVKNVRWAKPIHLH